MPDEKSNAQTQMDALSSQPHVLPHKVKKAKKKTTKKTSGKPR